MALEEKYTLHYATCLFIAVLFRFDFFKRKSYKNNKKT